MNREIEINKEIILDTLYFKANGKHYVAFEVPEEDFEQWLEWMKDHG